MVDESGRSKVSLERVNVADRQIASEINLLGSALLIIACSFMSIFDWFAV